MKLDKKAPGNRLILAGVWGFVGVLVAFLLLRNHGYGWDFRVYRDVALEYFSTGANPYTRDGWPLSYPPLVMQLFRPFTFLSPHTANLIWTLLTMGGFCIIFRLWNVHFLSLSVRSPFQILFIALAFNGALFYDVASGNIAGLQQLVLWVGIVALLRKRVWVYCVAVVLMSELKIDALFLLGLLLFIDEKPRWKEFFASLVAFAAIYALNYWYNPELFHTYLRFLSTLRDHNRGFNNPSSLVLSYEIIEAANTWGLNHPLTRHYAEALYAAVGGILAFFSWGAWRRIRQRGNPTDRQWIILFYLVLFGLVDPRVPPYQFPLFLLSALWIFEKFKGTSWVPLAAALAILPQPYSSFPRPISQLFVLFNLYLPLMSLYGIWALYVRSANDPKILETPGLAKSN